MDKTKQSHTKSRQNNLTLNPDKRTSTCTQFTSDLVGYTSNLFLNSTALPMATHPKVQDITLDPKLTYSTQICNISVHAQNPTQIIKTLTATG